MKCNALAMKPVLWTVATLEMAVMIVPTLKMLVSYVKVRLSLCMKDPLGFDNDNENSLQVVIKFPHLPPLFSFNCVWLVLETAEDGCQR